MIKTGLYSVNGYLESAVPGPTISEQMFIVNTGRQYRLNNIFWDFQLEMFGHTLVPFEQMINQNVYMNVSAEPFVGSQQICRPVRLSPVPSGIYRMQ